tara:strand:- start:1991 stop:4237 length:2247 start_codon:yes stop_codon:yes gene_type:complete
MNRFTKFLYAFIMVIVFTVATTFGQCPPGTWSLNVTINPDQYPEETSWYIMNFYGDTLMQGGPYTNIIDYQPQYAATCAPIDSFYFVIEDLYGDGVAGSLWGGNDGSVYIEQCGDTIWTLPVADFGYQIYDTIYTSGCPPPPPVFGCMDSSYVEFDLAATLDTGMCFTPIVYGCTDSLAYNYIDSANTDINIDSCMHELELTDLAGNGWAGSSLKLSQATSMIPPFNYQVVGTYTLLDGFDTTFFINLAAGYPVKAVFEITQQSDFTAVQCGYSLYSEDYYAIDIEGGFVNPIPPFFPITGQPYCGNTCIERTYGCIDSLAVNYNDTVNTDDGSCYYNPGCTNPVYLEYDASYDYDDGSCSTLIVLGCMDSTAYNYDPLANVELAGSCIPFVYGCMDVTMFNYDPLATAPDTCVPYIYGCTDASMFNYNINANTDNGSCIPFVYGCTDDTMFNYNPLANTDNGSCTPFVYGCMDIDAINYNPLANADDGTCIDVVLGCTDSTAFNYNALANTDDGSCMPVVWGCTDGAAFNYNSLANSDDGSCIPVIFGCIDPTMWNYCDTCNTDNGNCIPYYYGCTDSTALNYDDNANTDNGSCIYPLSGCTDASAVNYNPLANVADSSCYYSAGCNVGDIYYIPNECFEWVIDVDEYCCNDTWDNTCDYLYQYCLDGWSGPTDVLMLERLGISAYPNPSKGTVYFTTKLDVEVYNLLGEKILQQKETQVINLKQGFYILKIKKQKITTTIRIVINE